MLAEQTTLSRYRSSAPLPEREIEITIRLEMPAQDEADVSITIGFELPLSPPWDDRVVQQLYEGVHAGLAAAGLPLPPEGLAVQVSALRVAPPLGIDAGNDEASQVGDTVRALAAATVELLRNGLERRREAESA
jgi:hypothetical protein